MKKYSLGLLAVIFAVGSSFALKTYAPIWKFTGNPTIATERVDPTKYVLGTNDCGTVEDVLCAIEAPADPSNSSQPQITGSLHTALQNSGDSEPNFEMAEVIGRAQQ